MLWIFQSHRCHSFDDRLLLRQTRLDNVRPWWSENRVDSLTDEPSSEKMRVEREWRWTDIKTMVYVCTSLHLQPEIGPLVCAQYAVRRCKQCVSGNAPPLASSCIQLTSSRIFIEALLFGFAWSVRSIFHTVDLYTTIARKQGHSQSLNTQHHPAAKWHKKISRGAFPVQETHVWL